MTEMDTEKVNFDTNLRPAINKNINFDKAFKNVKFAKYSPQTKIPLSAKNMDTVYLHEPKISSVAS